MRLFLAGQAYRGRIAESSPIPPVAAYYTMRNVYTIHARQLIAPKTLDEVRTYEGPSLTKFVFDPLDAERDVSILFSTIMQVSLSV